MIPELERHCGSWVIVDRETGQSVIEIYTRSIVEKVNQERYEVLTALQWLVRLNVQIKQRESK